MNKEELINYVEQGKHYEEFTNKIKKITAKILFIPIKINKFHLRNQKRVLSKLILPKTLCDKTNYCLRFASILSVA